jgi:predicted DCC family thiol-disulfide oxidoreductase YuxK
VIAPGTYLLYDGGCRRCTRLAEQVVAASDGRLTMASLRAAEFQELLDALCPDRRFEPTLLTIDGGATRVVTGSMMRLRLLRLLRPRRTVRIARIARRYGVPVFSIGTLSTRSPEIWVGKRLGARWAITVTDDAVSVSSSTRIITLPVHVAGEIRYMSGRKRSFSVAKIPGDLDEQGRAVLVRILLREGFLRLSRPSHSWRAWLHAEPVSR